MNEKQEKLQQELEGNNSGTSPELNSTPTPTVEEQQDAGINPAPTQEPNPTEVTATATEEAVAEESNEPVGPEIPQENIEGSATKQFTQSQVDEIAGNVRRETREKTRRDFLNRYGVDSEDELDELFGRAQGYDTVREEFDTERKAWDEANAARDKEFTEVKERVALLESGIDQSRFEDAKLILRGKGLEVTPENIEAELATHPEWKPAPVPQTSSTSEDVAQNFKKKVEPQTRIDVLGNAQEPQPQGMTERDEASKLWNMKL